MVERLKARGLLGEMAAEFAGTMILILFGVGVLQVLLTAPGGLIDQVPRDIAKARRALGRRLSNGKGAAA